MGTKSLSPIGAGSNGIFILSCVIEYSYQVAEDVNQFIPVGGLWRNLCQSGLANNSSTAKIDRGTLDSRIKLIDSDAKLLQNHATPRPNY